MPAFDQCWSFNWRWRQLRHYQGYLSDAVGPAHKFVVLHRLCFCMVIRLVFGYVNSFTLVPAISP
ncbi:unnamed protein product, partial [Linum tenue]